MLDIFLQVVANMIQASVTVLLIAVIIIMALVIINDDVLFIKNKKK